MLKTLELEITVAGKEEDKEDQQKVYRPEDMT